VSGEGILQTYWSCQLIIAGHVLPISDANLISGIFFLSNASIFKALLGSTNGSMQETQLQSKDYSEFATYGVCGHAFYKHVLGLRRYILHA